MPSSLDPNYMEGQRFISQTSLFLLLSCSLLPPGRRYQLGGYARAAGMFAGGRSGNCGIFYGRCCCGVSGRNA